MKQVILATDLHLDPPAISDAAGRHARLISEHLRAATAPSLGGGLCVLTGDLTNDGAPEAYAYLAGLIERAPIPVVPMLGNHDIRAAALAAFAPLGHYEEGFAQGSIDLGASRLIFLDTLDEGTDAGVLCAARLDWLGRALDAAGERTVLIFMHHPPCDIGDADLDPIKLQNAAAFAEVLSGAADIGHIFFGHVHRTLFTRWHGIPCTALARPQAVGARHAQLPIATIACDGAQCAATVHTLIRDLPLAED